MKCSSSTGKPGKDFHAENMFRRCRRNQKNSNLVPNDKSLRPRGKIIISKAAKSSFIPKYRNRLSSIVTQKLIRANLVQEVGSDLLLKQSSFVRGQQKGVSSLMNGNSGPKRAERKSKINCSDGVQGKKKIITEKETDGISESSLSESPRKPMNKCAGDDMSRRPINYNLLSFSSDNEADQSSDASEPDCAERNFSHRKDTNDEKWLNLNSVTSRQSIEEKMAEVETPNENLDNYLLEHLPDEFDKEDLNGNYDTVEELVEVINTFENFNIAFPTKTFVYQASVKRCDSHRKEKESFDENKSNLENIVTAKLMGDIDLHLELENYLKAISTSDETGSCKVRTKNTLQQNHVNCVRGENTDFEGSNIIDNKFGISVSVGELNSSGNSENTNEKEKSKGQDSVSARSFNEAKTKSSSSFKSALSICTPTSPQRDKNLESQFFVFLDKKIENFLVSQENMDSKQTKDCTSYTFSQVLEESKNVKKIISENDASIQQDIRSKGHIKRTIGEMSFQPPQRDTIPPVLQSVKVQNSLPISLVKDTQAEPQSSLYEKMSPLEPYCEGKLKPNTKSSVLFKNSFYSTSVDSLKRNITSSESDSVQLCAHFSPVRESSKYKFDNRIEETIAEQEQSESVLSEKIIINKSPDESLKSQFSSITLHSSAENWSPSLQELIEIYSSVLKQNKKIRRCNIKRVKRCISSYLISFIHDKIKEKMHKKELINYAKERIGDSKLKIEEISNIYAGESKNSEKKNFSQLVEYVNRFQEVLTSSLSINQITQLNNIMAGLQDSSVEKYTPTKTVNKKKSIKINNSNSEKESSKSSIVSNNNKQKYLKIDRGAKKIKDVRDSISFRRNKLPKRNSFKTTATKVKSVKEVKLPPSAELESVLKSYLTNSEKGVGKDSQPGKNVIRSCDRKKNKFLVNVKLCENKIIVNGMQQFKSEKALSKAPIPSEKETSDLIIESVSNKQIEKLKCCSKQKSPKSLNVNKNINNKKRIKIPEVKTSKQGSHRFKNGGKHVKRKAKENEVLEDGKTARESMSHVLMQRTTSREKIFEDQEPFIHKFEYNHHQLKIQHPIEAIIESSESKISERTVDNYNEFLVSQEESKFHVEGEIVKDGEDVLSDKDLNMLKSLTKSSILSNVGSGEEPSIPSQRTYPRESSKRKIGTLVDLEKKVSRKKIAKFTKPPDMTNTLSLQSSKKSAPKKKKVKVLSSRPRSTYLCYPYLQCIQGDKMTKGKKDGKNRKFEDGAPSSCHRGTVLKTDSSRKGQNKTKLLKSISKGLSNLFKKASERREQSKTSKSNLKSSTGTFFETKHVNSKTSEGIIECQVSSSKVDQDDQSTELISFSLNGGSSFIVHNRSFVSLTSSERSSESDKHSRASGGCPNRLNNPEGNHSKYCGVEENDGCNSAHVKRSYTSQNSSGTTDSYRRPTIVIHARNEGNDDVSFPSLMVLSESFLRCYSNFALSRTKIKSLFKSHSDMKFCPGRVVDNPEEQTPFVTFVLTPKQKDEVGILDNQTKIETKPSASEEQLKKEIREEDFYVNFEQITHENSLRAIELFIETLSESRKRACKLKVQENKAKKTTQSAPKKLYVSASKPCPKKYKFTPCRRLQALFASKRKAYHECQKRSFPNKVENSKKGTCKRNPVSEKKKNSKSTNTTKVTEISSGNTNQREIERGNRRRNKSSKNTEMMKGEVLEGMNIDEKLELTTTKSRCIYQKELNNGSNDSNLNDEQNEINLLPDYVEQLKTAKNRVGSFKNKKRVIEANDEHDTSMVFNNSSDATERNQGSCNSEHDSDRKMQMTRNGKKISPVGNVRNCKSVDSSRKQMKGIDTNRKLKIHCTQSNTSKPETVEENSYLSYIEGIESPENSQPEISAEISDGERELLDSLLVKEERLENLERKSSTYFDAEESDESLGKAEQRSEEHSSTKWTSLRMNPSTQLRDTVPLLKKKGENLMIDKTDNRWRRILSLLDDVSTEMERSSEEERDDEKGNEGTAETKAMILNPEQSEPKMSKVLNFIKKQMVDRTKTFWNKVKTTNSTIDEGGESVQSTSFLSQNSFPMLNSFRIRSQQVQLTLSMVMNFNEVFSKLVDYLTAFIIKFNVEPENGETEPKHENELGTRSSSNWRELPVALYQSKSENLCGTNSSGFLIHQTNNLFNIPEALSEFPLKVDEANDRNGLQVLKQRIRKQRLLIQYLTNFPALPDVQVIKTKIIKKLRKLEKVVSVLEEKL